MHDAWQVPAAQCSPWLFVAVAGTLPFGTLFIELFFIMSSLWLGRVYYVFGFLLVVLALLVTVCAEVSVVLTYMGLCVEDWRWWWRAFFASGSVALYTLGYAVYYLVFELHSLARLCRALRWLLLAHGSRRHARHRRCRTRRVLLLRPLPILHRQAGLIRRVVRRYELSCRRSPCAMVTGRVVLLLLCRISFFF
jgi:hypothetical protein